MNTKQIKWLAKQNGTMINVWGVNLDGSDIVGHKWLGGEGSTVEEAICEALLMEGVEYDAAFEATLKPVVVWEE